MIALKFFSKYHLYGFGILIQNSPCVMLFNFIVALDKISKIKYLYLLKTDLFSWIKISINKIYFHVMTLNDFFFILD